MEDAIIGMANFDMGGQYLQIGKCVVPPDALTWNVPNAQAALPTSSLVE